MKKVFGILMIMMIILSSCATMNVLKIINPEVSFYGYDFRKYMEKDFLFLTDKYYDQYNLVGTMRMESYPVGEYKGWVKNTNYGVQTGYNWYFEDLNLEELIDNVYYAALKMGGDGFVNFQVKPVTKSVSTDEKGNLISNIATVVGIEISGDVIKRK